MAVALPFIAVALTAVGTGVGVYAAVAQGQAASDAAKFNAGVARNNALAAQQQAQFEASRIRKRNLVLLGKQRAAAAKSGVTLSGSAADVIFDSAVEGELDALAALYTGKVQAGNYRSKAKLDEMAADNAKTSSYLAAGGTLLTGASRALSLASENRSQPSFSRSESYSD